jgi:hypothetical protein
MKLGWIGISVSFSPFVESCGIGQVLMLAADKRINILVVTASECDS